MLKSSIPDMNLKTTDYRYHWLKITAACPKGQWVKKNPRGYPCSGYCDLANTMTSSNGNIYHTGNCILFYKWDAGMKYHTADTLCDKSVTVASKRRLGIVLMRDDVIKWKSFPCCWPFVWGIHLSIPPTKSSDARLWCCFWSAPKQTIE